MPQLERWDNLPEGVRQHLIERMREREISVSNLNQLRLWVETRPEVPEGDWYKDFGSFKLCGEGEYPKTFLLKGQPASGEEIEQAVKDRWWARRDSNPGPPRCKRGALTN